MEGNLRFKIDWASLIVGMKFTVFSLFCFVSEGNFQVQAPGGAYIRRGDLTEGFLHYEFGGLISGGAYFWNFMVSPFKAVILYSFRAMPPNKIGKHAQVKHFLNQSTKHAHFTTD